MSAYLRWVGWQLYLLVFWPSRFKREVEDDEGKDGPQLSFRKRGAYMVRMLPATLILTAAGVCIAGLISDGTGVAFDWQIAAVCVAVCGAVSVVAGGAFGVADGVVSSVVSGVTVGVAFGVAFGGAFGSLDGGAVGIVLGAAVGIVLGAAVGVTYGVADGVMLGVAGSVVSGVAFGVMVGAAFGAAVGVVFGVALSVTGLVIRHRLLGFPVNALLGWRAWRKASTQTDVAFRCWRWHPVRWNEVIWLPVPKLGKFLALLVRQDREEGFKVLAFVAAERQLQRRAIPKALAEIALEDLAADSLTRIAEVAERLAWRRGEGMAELPGDLALDGCERVAERVAQYLTMQDAWRRRTTLAEAGKELDQIRKALALSAGRNAPRVLRRLNRWAALLEAEIARLATEPIAKRQLPQPFAFGNPLREEQANIFAARTDVLADLERALLDTAVRPALLLHGPRRMGKSSLLRQLPRLLGPDLAPAYLDLQQPGATDSAARLLHAMARAISEGLRARRVETRPPTLEHLQADTFGRFGDWLEKVEEALPGSLRIVLALDEYEKLHERAAAGAAWGGDVLDLTRHWMQHHPRLSLLFTGMHAFADLGPAWTSRFVSVRKVRVSFLQREALVPILTRPVPEFDLVWEPGAMEALLDATAAQPFLSQAVAFELVQFLNEQDRRTASPADVEAACRRAMDSGAAYFENVWDDIGEDGRALVRTVCRGEPPPADSAAARVRVQEQEVLDAALRFKVPLVERWMRNKAGLSA